MPTPLDKQELRKILEEIARLLELNGENPFKTRAYNNAARTVAALDEELDTVIAEGRLGSLKGFGKALVEKVTELAETGRLRYLDELRAGIPPGLLAMADLPGLGPRKVRLFHAELGIDTVEALEIACRDGRVAELPGCGARTAEKIINAIERRRHTQHLHLYPEVRNAAERILAHLRAEPALARAAICGSLRRYKEITKDADILAAGDAPERIMQQFVTAPDVAEIQSRGPAKASVILDSGIQVDLRVVPLDTFATALQHFTGSREHNVAIRSRALKRGLRSSEHGLFRGDDTAIPCSDEADIYRHLGLRFIPPELREGMGEIDTAESADFPRLVDEADYRGVLHCHSIASDGRESIEELIEFTRAMGHSFLGITDHSRSQVQANGLSAERLEHQIEMIRSIRADLPPGFRLFSGIECDILADGSLDYPDALLDRLDFVIASVHSGFTNSRETMTERVVKAIRHPATRIIGHPTGRLLLRRDPYAIDMDAVLAAAAEHKVAIELNCHPMRMDMDWRLWRAARDRGVVCSLNPDAHSRKDFGYIPDGIRACRKGWLRAEDVLNCRPADAVARFLGAR